MKQALQTLMMFSMLSARVLVAHEGHDIPGALPPAPHRGVIQEAVHGGSDHHHGKEEKELFFEVVQQGTDLRVYPLVLLDGAKTFTPVKKAEMSDVSLKTENPRTKKTEVVKAEIADDHIKGTFDPKGANRFFVHVATNFEKEKKAAKIQVVAE